MIYNIIIFILEFSSTYIFVIIYLISILHVMNIC